MMLASRHPMQLAALVKVKVPRGAALRYLAAAICALILIRYVHVDRIYLQDDILCERQSHNDA
jgi:hypothetical protein